MRERTTLLGRGDGHVITCAPLLLSLAGAPTLPAFAMSYVLGAPGEHARALTKNKEDNAGSGTLDTLTVVDGLGRVVQVHTEAEVAQGSSKAYGVIVSGVVRYDAAGRVTSQGQPAFRAGFPSAFVEVADSRPTRFLFDPLDRTTQVYRTINFIVAARTRFRGFC